MPGCGLKKKLQPGFFIHHHTRKLPAFYKSMSQILQAKSKVKVFLDEEELLYMRKQMMLGNK